MTPLRQRLIEEIALRGYSPRTQEAYVHAVACLAKYYGRAPDTLGDEELRGYLLQLHLKGDKARSTLNVAVSGLRFFYQRVLHRPFTHLERNLPRPRPAHLGEYPSFNAYAERIHEAFKRLGVIKY